MIFLFITSSLLLECMFDGIRIVYTEICNNRISCSLLWTCHPTLPCFPPVQSPCHLHTFFSLSPYCHTHLTCLSSMGYIYLPFVRSHCQFISLSFLHSFGPVTFWTSVFCSCLFCCRSCAHFPVYLHSCLHCLEVLSLTTKSLDFSCLPTLCLHLGPPACLCHPWV